MHGNAVVVVFGLLVGQERGNVFFCVQWEGVARTHRGRVVSCRPLFFTTFPLFFVARFFLFFSTPHPTVRKESARHHTPRPPPPHCSQRKRAAPHAKTTTTGRPCVAVFFFWGGCRASLCRDAAPPPPPPLFFPACLSRRVSPMFLRHLFPPHPLQPATRLDKTAPAQPTHTPFFFVLCSPPPRPFFGHASSFPPCRPLPLPLASTPMPVTPSFLTTQSPRRGHLSWCTTSPTPLPHTRSFEVSTPLPCLHTLFPQPRTPPLPLRQPCG